jgi:hypothetical protein
MLKTITFLLVACAFVSGCSTPGSYIRIPERFTTLPIAPDTESYLIEVVHKTEDPGATRYEFTFENGIVSAQVSKIAASGARSERRRTGETASRLLEVLRSFDWGSIEAPLPDEDGRRRIPDDTEVVIKARTQKSYREAHVRLSQCAELRKLLESLEAVN